jgi:phospholipid transport system substrate-binding protein
MLIRRNLLAWSGLLLGLALAFGAPPAARAQDENAVAFVRNTGSQLVAVIDSAEPESVKRQQLQRIVDRDLDVQGIAKFALGPFWRAATQQQRQEYTALFHEVLLNSITAKIGEYRGVRFSVGRSTPTEGGVAVHTTIYRPNAEPTHVEWLVTNVAGAPKIEDVIAEGTSLRITQRSDYQSYLRHNGDSVPTLIRALRQQVAQASG